METFTRGIGRMVRLMGMGSLWILMAVCMRGSGLMTSNMALGRRAGIIIKLSILAILCRGRSRGRVGLNLKGGIMKGILWMGSFMGMGSITLRILVNFLKGNLKIIIWMVRVL